MSHDVFISYSFQDKAVADAVCATLEGKKIRCWIAPRDILPSMDWGESIIDAISNARVMVLVFSSSSNNSDQVKRELQNAVSEGVAILPLRIEDVTPTKSMRYFLGSHHWLDALTPPLEKHLERLAETVGVLLSKDLKAKVVPEADQKPEEFIEEPKPEASVSLSERLKSLKDLEERKRTEAAAAEQRRREEAFEKLKITLGEQLDREAFTEALQTVTTMLRIKSNDSEAQEARAVIERRLATADHGPKSNAWEQMKPSGAPPERRERSSMVFDPGEETIYLFGGVGLRTLSDLWAYSLNTDSWEQLKPSGMPAPPRSNHSAIWDSDKGKMYVFGRNLQVSSLNELWAYSAASNSWAPLILSGTLPAARNSHTAVWDTTKGKMYVFGGSISANDVSSLFNDLWAFTRSTNTWEQLIPSGGPPPARLHHSAVWDPTSDKMYIFGGWTGRERTNDLWAYNSSTNKWEQLKPSGPWPLPRNAHSAVWDASKDKMYIFGGICGGFLNDLWAYSPSQNSWEFLNPMGVSPPARSFHSAAWCLTKNRMYVFGGCDGQADMNDLWVYTP